MNFVLWPYPYIKGMIVGFFTGDPGRETAIEYLKTQTINIGTWDTDIQYYS